MLGDHAGNGNRQIVVKKDQIEPLIKKGWEFVAQLDDKVILKLPDSK